MAEIKERDRVLYLFDAIESSTVLGVIGKILEFNMIDDELEKTQKTFTRKPIYLYINSGGGKIYDGFGLIDCMNNSKTPIYTICLGIAASMAFDIFICGHKRFIGKYSRVMIHQLSGGTIDSLGIMKEYLNLLDGIEVEINDIVLSKTNIKESELKDVYDKKKDWWLSSSEAIKYGCADYLFDEINNHKEVV